MRIRFGTILSLLMRRRINENMVWTDSQDYGADEILSHPFALTPPVQRAACALHFEGSVPSRINRNHPINQIFTSSFYLSHFPKGYVPLFFPYFSSLPISHSATYQIVCKGYCGMILSRVTSANPASKACAIRSRSNGSR